MPGQSVDLQNVPATVKGAAAQLAALTNPNSANIDPDLKTLINLFGEKIHLRINASDISTFAQGFDRQARVTTQGLDVVKELLPTGTRTYGADGTPTYVPTPTDGYVEIDQRSNTRIEANWKVAGAGTVFLNAGHRYDVQTGQLQELQQELPTNATASVTVAGKTVAALAFRMDPGDCLNTAGPIALTLSGWAGRATQPPVRMDLAYVWTDKNISFNASAVYHTTTQQVSAALKMDVTGSTTDRCGENYAFTPTRADMSGTLDIPGYRTDFNVYLRDLSNLTINSEAMQAQNPFLKIGGNVNASLNFNGAAVLTAVGPLADGSDMNLQPGDQVRFQYVKNGQLITTDLDGALRDIQPILAPQR